MKNTIVSSALIAGAICLNVNLHAQEKAAMQGNSTANTEKVKSQETQTVLSGSWSLSFDGAGSLHIFDKNNATIRVIEGVGAAVQQSNGSVFNSPSTYPVKLSVDMAGDLHIVDQSAYAATGASPVRLLLQNDNSFNDPDMPKATSRTTDMVVLSSKLKKD
jgi:hypothetical protein